MTPEVFGEWLLLERLGGRSMSEAFLAVRLGDRAGRLFVVKRPALGERASGTVAEALRREAQVLGERRWVGAAAMDASGELAGLPYVAVEHVRGVSLDRLLCGTPLSESAALLVGRDLARTLAELHAHAYVHGDVAPSNVLVDEAGDVTLVDFGLVRKVGEERGGPSGKPGYASPDAALGKPAKTEDDIYAWGALVAECLTGRRLFDERELAEAAARSTDLPSDVSRHTLVARALSLSGGSRPQASDLLELSIGPGAREELAERAQNEARSVNREAAALPKRVVEAMAPAVPVRVEAIAPPREAAPQGIRRPVVAALVFGFVGFGVFGFVAGRRSAKLQAETRDATITIPSLPARTQVAIDGRTVILPEAGRPLPIEPGRHTITVNLPRDEREYDVFIQPGDHVVLVPLQRSKPKKE